MEESESESESESMLMDVMDLPITATTTDSNSTFSKTPPTVNYCFLCLSERNPEPESDLNSSSEQDNHRDQNILRVQRKNEYHLTLKYLLHSCHDNQDKSQEQLQLINKLLPILLTEQLHDKRKSSSRSSICGHCEDRVKEIVKLHCELEHLQNKLVSQLNILKDLIISGSVYGENEESKWKMEQLENWAYTNNDNNHQPLSIDSIKETRNWLDSVVELQTAIFERTGETKEVSCTYLQKCILAPPFSLQYEKKSENIEHRNSNEDINTDDPPSPWPPAPATDFLENVLDAEEMETEVKQEKLSPTRIPVSPMLEKVRKRELKSATTTKKQTKSKTTKMNLRQRQKPSRGSKTRKLKLPSWIKLKVSGKRPGRTGKPRQRTSYQCLSCEFEAFSAYTFVQHLRSHETPEKTHFCHQCDEGSKGFSGEQFFNFHMLEHTHGEKFETIWWKCNQCGKRFPPTKLTNHVISCRQKRNRKNSPDAKFYPCPNCYHCSISIPDYIQHSCLFHAGVPQKCLFCDEIFAGDKGKLSRKKWVYHMYKDHDCKDILLPCNFPGCTEVFLMRVELYNHKALHESRNICPFCGVQFPSASALSNHKQSKHLKTKCFSCDVEDCEESFQLKNQLERHRIEVHNFPKIKCDLCSLEYFDTRGLQIHKRRIHEYEGKTFQCATCSKTFATPLRLRKHEFIHGPRNEVCEKCGFAAKSKSMLRKHMVIHLELARLPCPHCDKRFNYRRALENHIRTHTGEKPYTCHHCGVSFAQKQSMTNHVRNIHESSGRGRRSATEKKRRSPAPSNNAAIAAATSQTPAEAEMVAIDDQSTDTNDAFNNNNSLAGIVFQLR